MHPIDHGGKEDLGQCYNIETWHVNAMTPRLTKRTRSLARGDMTLDENE